MDSFGLFGLLKVFIRVGTNFLDPIRKFNKDQG